MWNKLIRDDRWENSSVLICIEQFYSKPGYNLAIDEDSPTRFFCLAGFWTPYVADCIIFPPVLKSVQIPSQSHEAIHAAQPKQGIITFQCHFSRERCSRPCSFFVVFWFLFRCQILEGRNRYAVTHPGVLIFLVSDWSTLLSSDWVQMDQ